ncbi:hypothetical protein [uncultured Polaribacter sp.]|uniref:hypothetical protein n=1 Tax=uncultured Polaribacter sp. TaxID=174711 RepID=UPI0030DD0C7F
MMKKLTPFYFILFFNMIITGQNNDFNTSNHFPQEKIYAHTNSNFFLNGETLFYKIYCLDARTNSPSQLSKIAYIELIDNENKSIYKQKISLENGVGNGDFFLNSATKTGTYKLISYTQWMRNKQTFFEENIFIVNPFLSKLTIADSTHQQKTESLHTPQTNFLNLSSDKKKYGQRDKITLNFDGDFAKNLSISVKKYDSIEIESKINSISFLNSKSLNTNATKEYLPELRGELYHGKITTINTTTVNKKIGLSFIGENKISKTSITNAKGEFYFTIDKPYSSENVLIEVLEEDAEKYTITLFNTDELEKKFTDFNELYLTENIRKTIKKRSLYVQIENAYQQTKLNTLLITPLNTPVFFGNKNNVIYNLDDYNRFKTVKEVTIEILQDVWLSKENNRTVFRLRDINLESSSELETLLIVDGYIVSNHESFLGFDALKIKSIELVKEKYQFGAKNYHGIIQISTFKNDYKPIVTAKNSFTILKPSAEKAYFSPDYSVDKLSKIPDFRTQLFWNANLNSASNQISFFASDVKGTFEATIEGFTKEGLPIYEKTFFTVE